jgi:hypothetical protein
MSEVRPHRTRWTRIVLIVLGLAALPAAAWYSPLFEDTRAHRTRAALFEELQPVALENCVFGRLGGSNDSGFVMCKNLLEGVASAYSYGIVGNDDWGCDVATRFHVPVHQYDCLDPPRPACADGKLVFHVECLGDRRKEESSRWFDSLGGQIANNHDSGKRLVVKIDVEGAEWDALMATPDEVFAGIEQIAIEFHGVDEGRFLRVIRKLKRSFHIANLYFNNNSCTQSEAPFPAWAYQVLLVNKQVAAVDESEPSVPLPSGQNARDNPFRPDCQPEVPDRLARERQIREKLLQELRPVALKNCTMARFGSVYDGGYLMCENLIQNLGALYSYGVGPNDEFGCDVSTRYKVPVRQYDCFDPARPVCSTGTFDFHDECIAERRERAFSRNFDTLANQIAANGDAGKRLIVKIDVEGAEWEALMATPDEVLAAIDQLPMELHGVNDRRYIEVLEKLKKNFYLVNLHFNNHSCGAESAPLPGWAYQVLFVNKRLGELDPSQGTPPMSPLNAPDTMRRPDCQVDFSRQ